MIDWSRVKILCEEVGKDDFAEVVELFFEEMGAALARLDQNRDLSRLAAALHFLKGSALNLGFRQVAELCGEGEQWAAQRRAAEVRLDRIQTAYRQSRAEFERDCPLHLPR